MIYHIDLCIFLFHQVTIAICEDDNDTYFHFILTFPHKFLSFSKFGFQAIVLWQKWYQYPLSMPLNIDPLHLDTFVYHKY